MGGRARSVENGMWSVITYCSCTSKNNFVPELPAHSTDMIYLCYQNKPTGTTLSREELEKWVAYALAHHSILLYDAAYEAYITTEGIYALPPLANAKTAKRLCVG